MAPRNLSQAEIWDDRALVNSWNDALEEYKKYHSIAAKGQNVEEVLKTFEDSDGAVLGVEADDDIEGDAVVLPAQTHDTKPKAKHHKASKNNGVDSEPVTAPQEIPTTVPPTGLPHSVFSTTQDESMKNLMMSWYYAGYYTGLAEGQQKARTETEAQPNH